LEDAFQVDWDGLICLFNPPFHKMEEALIKLRASKCQAIVVCPHWTKAKWWRHLSDGGFVHKRTLYSSVYKSPENKAVPLLDWPTTICEWRPV
jgi:hypothetical protein